MFDAISSLLGRNQIVSIPACPQSFESRIVYKNPRGAEWEASARGRKENVRPLRCPLVEVGNMRICSDLMDRILFGAVPLLFGIAAFFVFLALDIRRRRLALVGVLRLPVLAIFDLLPPALTAGFVTALIADLYPEASARGVLPLRSPSTLGMVLCLAFLPIILAEGRKQIQFQRPFGLLFAEWLVFAGAARILLFVVFHHLGEALINRSVL